MATSSSPLPTMTIRRMPLTFTTYAPGVRSLKWNWPSALVVVVGVLGTIQHDRLVRHRLVGLVADQAVDRALDQVPQRQCMVADGRLQTRIGHRASQPGAATTSAWPTTTGTGIAIMITAGDRQFADRVEAGHHIQEPELALGVRLDIVERAVGVDRPTSGSFTRIF